MRRVFAGWVVSLLLVAGISITGWPAVAEAMADAAGTCTCDHHGRPGCPPACSDGCTRTVPAVVDDTSTRRTAAPAHVERRGQDDAVTPVAPPPDDVFHPPIR